MLLLFGLMFIFLDLVMGGVDVLHDMVGFLLLTIQCIVLWRNKKMSSAYLMLGTLALVVAVSSVLPFPLPLLSIGMELVMALLAYILVKALYREYFRQAYEDPKHHFHQDDLAGTHSLVMSCLVLVLLCELCNPILSLVTYLSYILWAIKTAAGIYIIVRMYQISHWETRF